MSNIEKEIRQVINDIYDNDLPKNMVKTIVSKALGKLASSNLIEEDAKKRNIRIVASVMDALDESELVEEGLDDLFINSKVKGALVVEASVDELSWDDIKHAFNETTFKFSSSDRRSVDENLDYDQCHEELLREGVSYKICHDYGDLDDDTYDEEARAYSTKSMKETDANLDNYPIGVDRRKKLQPGNLLDEAVDTKRTRSDFSTSK